MLTHLIPHFCSLRTALGVLLAALLSACGSGVEQATPAAYVPGTGNLVVNTAALASMPQANSATVSVVIETGTAVIAVNTPLPAAAFPSGRYVGSGTGNKAVIGLDGFDGLKLADLTGIELDAKQVTGPVTPNLMYMNFLVDLDCVKNEDLSVLSLDDLKLSRRILVWDASRIGGAAIAGSTYTRYSTSSNIASWRMVGVGAGTATFSGLKDNNVGPDATLTQLIADYPNACLIDGVSGDNGLLRNQSIASCVSTAALPRATTKAECGLPHKAALLLVGDSGNVIEREWRVSRLKIKDRLLVVQ
jgi:hypothetical protein